MAAAANKMMRILALHVRRRSGRAPRRHDVNLRHAESLRRTLGKP
jgi:hypothetical protein